MSTAIVVVLWITAFSLTTSLLIGSGIAVLAVAASTVSDVVEITLEAVASAIRIVLDVIASFVSAVLHWCGC